MNNHLIQLGHGSGGRMSRNLITQLFARYFANDTLRPLGDSSYIAGQTSQLAFTTDSYVIDPVFFPGGNIGQLAVCGTVNDLAVSGAIPRFLSAGFILEEGLSLKDLEKIVAAMAVEAANAKVQIVTGDTKVVRRGQCDKIYINTSGIGEIPEKHAHFTRKPAMQPGDKILLSGSLGDHAIAVLAARENLYLEEPILSDVAPLNHLAQLALEQPEQVLQMRDITRGGLATILVELCENQSFGIEVLENEIPIKQPVRSVCELFGFDPLYLANEGKMLLIVKNGTEKDILKRLRSNLAGANATLIGEITDRHPGKAIMQSVVGGKRLLDMLHGELVPRIC